VSIEATRGEYVWRQANGKERRLPRYHSIEATKARPGLEVWKQKRIVDALAHEPDLIELARADTYAAVRAVLDTQSYEAALGTSVHTVTAELDRGHSLTFTDEELRGLVEMGVDLGEVRAHVKQWHEAKSLHRLGIIAIERVVIVEALDVAGALDRIVTAPALGLDTPVLLDIKTGREVYADVALQLATYAHGSIMFDEDHEGYEPMPFVNQDWALCAHLRPDGCRIIPIDISCAFGTVEALRRLFGWERDASTVVGAPLKPPSDEEEYPW